MSATPRTDAIAHRGYGPDVYIAKTTNLCRELERELNFERKAAKQIHAANEQLKTELAAERALADRMAGELRWRLEAGGYGAGQGKQALASWKEVRHE